MKVELTPDAERELDQAVAWYDSHRHSLGDEFYDSVVDAIAQIGHDPERFPLYEHTPADREIRRCRLTRFPYIVVYEIVAGVVYVLAVAHGSRRPAYWKSDQA